MNFVVSLLNLKFSLTNFILQVENVLIPSTNNIGRIRWHIHWLKRLHSRSLKNRRRDEFELSDFHLFASFRHNLLRAKLCSFCCIAIH